MVNTLVVFALTSMAGLGVMITTLVAMSWLENWVLGGSARSSRRDRIRARSRT